MDSKFKVTVLLLFIASVGWCDPRPVNPAWLHGRRLEPPNSGVSVVAPKGWMWFDVTSSDDHEDFMALDASSGRRFIFSVLQDDKALIEPLVEGFVKGMRQTIESEGGRVVGFLDRPSSIPVKGSYCITFQAIRDGRSQYYAFGYMAPGPHPVFLEEFRPQPGPSDDFMAFVASYRTKSK